MTQTGYFNIERDNILIEKGSHFFCGACSVARLLEEQSPDPRYCQGCYGFLGKEAKILSGVRRPGWVPKSKKAGRRPTLHPLPDALASMDIIEDKADKVTFPIIQLCPPPKANTGLAKSKRGPKAHGLPEDLIRHMAGQGMSPQAIARKLADEHQVFVSYKTIKRRLQGVLV